MEQEKEREKEKEKRININNTIDTDIYFEGDIDIDFDVGDSKEIHEQHQEYQSQRNEMQKKDEEEQQKNNDFIAMNTISYKSIIKNKSNGYKQTYIYGGKGFDIFEGKEVYTSTLLRFSGIDGLRENKDEDLVKEKMINDVKFNESQIEKIQIKNGSSWCFVHIRASIKFIRDKLKNQKSKNKKISQQNRENRFGPNPNQKPIYYVNEYIPRSNTDKINNDGLNENKKLYILNFDILNKNCHKAFTNLFLKFGDLQHDIQIGINTRDDPFAKVTYKDINDAKTLWSYQNINGDPKKKITFGGRQLNIQYAKY